MVKKLGIGTYRMALGNQVHHSCLKRALDHSHGSNFSVVDTSPNYGDGLAECIVGKIIGEMRNSSNTTSIEIMSKFGYLQGNALENAQVSIIWL